ncbi:hypothetical protein ACFLZI_02030, partial [Nitrospirota bacterium]
AMYDPVKQALEFFKDKLTDNGTLVIAIENQLGLKFFAGFSEDHNGIKYDGIAGYPALGRSHPMTFSKRSLSHHIKDAGFPSIEFYYPFPDYKFPECIISNRLFENDENINVGEMIGQYKSVDYLRKHMDEFNEKLSWWELGQAGLVPDIANSFIVLAGNSISSAHISAPWEVKLFNQNRGKRLSSVTTFMREGETLIGQKSFPYYSLDDIKSAGSGKLEIKQETVPWIYGASLSFELEKSMASLSFSTEKFANSLEPWVRFLAGDGTVAAETSVSGDYLDAMPWNLIPTDEGFQFIDHELRWKDKIPLSICVTRGIYYMVERNFEKYGYFTGYAFKSVRAIVLDTCNRIFSSYGVGNLDEFVRFETELGNAITGKPASHIRQYIKMRLRKRVLPIRFLIRKITNKMFRLFYHLHSAFAILLRGFLIKRLYKK